LQLVDGTGKATDVVVYRDGFPWPHAADALGAGDKWLKPVLLPLTKHQHRGHSLERLSPDVAASEIGNWDVSPLDQPSPGRASGGWGKPIPGIVEALEVAPMGGMAGAALKPADAVVLSVRLSPQGMIGMPRVELFVDDLTRTDEARMTVPLTGVAPTLTATLPKQNENSIVRYRILGDRGAGVPPVVSPRASDPYEWHAYFVGRATPVQAAAQVYQLFIAPADWGRLYQMSASAHVQGCSVNPPMACPATACTPNPNWSGTVNAVFVFEGRVHDVHARYQGSRHNRLAGPSIAGWPAGVGPTPALSPMRALSWTLKFPRYREFAGKDTVALNKLRPNVCWGLESALGGRLYASAGIPFYAPRFVRFYINGAYYQYAMEWIDTGETLAGKFYKNQAAPDIYESKGYYVDEGPFGVGDQRRIAASCGHAAAARYATTYDKKNNDWRGHEKLIEMIDALHTARATNNAMMVRAYFEKYWDLDKLMTYVAIRNWSSTWDDAYHNHNLAQRADGKWEMFPWDVDDEFKGPTTSPYLGDQANRVVAMSWNYIKDTLFTHLRADYNRKMMQLIGGPLAADKVSALVDEAVKDINMGEARAAPTWSAAQCDLAARASAFKTFARNRNAHLPTALR